MVYSVKKRQNRGYDLDSFNQLNLLTSSNFSQTVSLDKTGQSLGLSLWQERGVLRSIDRQWIEQLAFHAGEDNHSLLVAGALCSLFLGNGHTCIDLAAIQEKPPEGITVLQLKDELALDHVYSVEDWCRTLLSSSLVMGSDGFFSDMAKCPMVLAGTRLYLYRYFQYEQKVLAYLLRQFNISPFEPDKALIEQLFPEKTDEVDWQKVAVANVASLPFSVISGGPGTGKTTMVTKLLALLVAQSAKQGKSLRIELAAPTGKAAARLKESIFNTKTKLFLNDEIKQAIPEKASTLHCLLGSDFGRSRFRHHKDNPLHLDVLLVDEASMVDLPMMAKLIDAMPPHARLILLGDKDQLASVEAGSVLGDVSLEIEKAYFQPDWAARLTQLTGENVNYFANPTAPPISRTLTLLRKNYRFDANSGIEYLAKAINSGDIKRVLACLQANYRDVHWYVPDERQTKLNIAVLAKGYDVYWEAVGQKVDTASLYKVFFSYQILTAMRQGEFGVEQVNKQIEQYFYQRGRMVNPHVWYPGKAVMLTRNDADLGLFNGDIGLCMPDITLRLRVWFMQPDGSFTGLLPSRLSEFEVVFAMTVHKSQGSEFEHVSLLLPMTPSPVLTRELIYTGITRARKEFTLWGSEKLVMAVAQTSIERHSGLSEELWQHA